MRKDLTDITLIVDRSGSMDAIRADAEGGIATLVAEQAAQPGSALLTLVQFDTAYEVVHRGVPIASVPRYTLIPRGNTALLDAVGRAIAEGGERLAAMSEADRPGLVLVVIVTDGQENSSVEYTKDRVKQMIEHQQAAYGWHFTYLGANQDAFAEAGGIGIPMSSSANYAAQKVGAAYEGTSSKLARMREQSLRDEPVQNEFTDEERSKMN